MSAWHAVRGKSIPWLRRCRKCGEMRPMAGGRPGRNGTNWVCAQCKPKAIVMREAK